MKGIQVLLKHKKNGTLLLDLACFECINVIVATQIAINEQLKDLTHMFYFLIPCHKPYKEGLISYVFTLKYMCHFERNFKKLNRKAKHEIKKIKFMAIL